MFRRYLTVCLKLGLWLIALGIGQSFAENTPATLEHVAIQLKWQHAFQFAGYYAALEKGYYQAEGLDVELKQIDFSKDYVKQVLAGESEYGVSDSTLLIYHLKNEPVVLINQFFQHSPLVFLSKRDSGIISPFEMVNKKVAFNTTNLGDAALNALLLKTLGSLAKIKQVPFNEQHQLDFIDGKIDVVSAYSSSQPFLLKELGIDVNIINPQNYGIDFYGDNLYTTRKEIADHPERVKKISRATVKGWHYALAHSEEIIDVILKKYNPKLSRAYLQYEAKATQQMIISDVVELGSVEPERYKQAAEDYRRLGFVTNDHIDDSFFYLEDQVNSAFNSELTPEERTWIQAHPVIRVGVEKDWAPYDFIDQEGHPTGLSHELVELIGDYSGLKFDYVVDDWHVLIEKAKRGELDLLPAIFESNERERYLTYSQTYHYMLDYFFIHEEVQAVSFDDLAGKTIAIPKDFIHIEVIKKQFPQLKILEVDNLMAAMNSVIERKADLLLDIHSVITYLLKKNAITTIKPFRVLPPGEARRLHMAVRKDLPILASIVRKSIDAIPITDKIDLEDKWFERTPSKNSKPIYISKAEQKWLAEHPIIRFSGDPKWLPYEAFDHNGRYIGIVAEYLRLIEQKLRIHLEIVPTKSWTETVQKIKQGEIDVISETIDSDLNKQLTFTHAYLSSPVVIVMRDEEVYVDDISQISDKRIGLVKEYGYNPAIIKQYPDIKFYEVESVQDGLTHVSTRKLDALICTLAQASYHISEQGVNNVRIVGKTQFATKLGYGMRPEFAPLVPLFNRALNTINPNDKQKILENWGKEQFIEKIDYSLVFKIIGGFLLLLLLTFLWNRRLVHEIQRRKLSEQKVLLLNKRLALATEVLALGLWELEFGEQLALIFDERSLAIYELAPDAPLDFDVWLSVVHPDDRHLLKQLIFTIENNQTPTPIEFRLKNSASGVRTIYCAATAVREGDHIIKVTGVNWDISDRKKAELALATAKEQAEHANKAKSQFLANMSHEIRTPLNAIIGFTELLSEQIKEPKHLSFVQTIQSAGQNLLALINDILDLSKIEAGKLNIEKNVCNPHDLFNELNHIFSLKVREKNLQLQLDVDPKIPEHLILDAVRLRQVLFNLIGNAVKFTDTGYVRLSARTTNEDDIHSKLDLVIEVEDTGIGIDKSQQHIVFNDFEQSEGQDYRKYGGTGLGLAISSRLTEMMGGIISLSSQLGVGTTFTIHLFDVDVAVMSGEQQPEALPVPVGKINFHPGVVLVVDDVTNNRSLLRESFADTSLTILEAENGLIAVNMVKQNAIDLILMDIRMPVMDGYEAAALIKSISDIPIIALTASVMRDQYERLKSSNFEGYLRKPVLKADLHQELTKFLAFDTVTENATPEKQEATLQLTHDELALLPSVLDKLVELQSLCAQSLKNNNLTDAKNFADALSALSETSSIALVLDYANTLQEHIDCFDLLAIQQQLSNFPALVQALSEFKPALRG